MRQEASLSANQSAAVNLKQQFKSGNTESSNGESCCSLRYIEYALCVPAVQSGVQRSQTAPSGIGGPSLGQKRSTDQIGECYNVLCTMCIVVVPSTACVCQVMTVSQKMR